MKTVAEIKKHIGTVSPSDIGRAHKFFDGATAYYLVESSDKVDEQTGSPIEYKVQYSREHGFTCSCPSGQYGFANVKHASGVCSHCRIALAAAQEEKTAMAEIALKDACGVLAEEKKPAAKPLTKAEAAFYRNEERRQKQWLADLAFIREFGPK